MVPDRLRGRTMAIYSMMFMGMAPFGALLSGALADRIGAPWTVASAEPDDSGRDSFRANLPKFAWRLARLPRCAGLAGEPAQEMAARLSWASTRDRIFCYTARAFYIFAY